MSRQSLLLTSWGRGNGHITRLLSIGKAFADHGWTGIVLGHRDRVHASLVAQAGFDCTSYPPWAEEADPWTQWADRDFLERSVVLDLQVLRRYAPTRVINDNRLSMLIACAAAGVPVVTLCQDNQLPGFRYNDEPVAAIWTDPIDAVNGVLRRYRMRELNGDVRWLFALGRIAIPSSPALEPVAHAADLEVVHTGVLSTRHSRTERPPTDLLMYRTVGTVDAALRSAFKSWGGTIFIATGDAEKAEMLHRQASELRPTTCHFRVAALWDLGDVGPGLRAAVHHGGHGISTTCIAAEIPSVVLPGHNPERRANGERAATLRLADVVLPQSDSGTRWGPAVDVTGDRPTWGTIRRRLEQLMSQEPRQTREPALRLSRERLVEVLS